MTHSKTKEKPLLVPYPERRLLVPHLERLLRLRESVDITSHVCKKRRREFEEEMRRMRACDIKWTLGHLK